MSAPERRPPPIELSADWSLEEALILWRFCTELSDRIWERHESELVERLMAEEYELRCERHPWERRPCMACESEAGEANLEFLFEEEQNKAR